MADTVIALQQSENMRYFVTGKTTPRTGNRYPGNCPFGTYQAKDGTFVIGAGNDTLFDKLCRNVIKKPEYAEDERFGSISDRVAHREEIRELLEEWAADYTVDQVVEKLLAQGIPAGPILSIAEISEDPHFVEARKMFPIMEQPGIGEMRVNGVPIKLSESELAIQRPAPMLGEHNDEVYRELLGLNADEIAELKAKGTI